MWSGSNQRIKALMAARERERARLNRPIHIRRANISLRMRAAGVETVVPARALLNDFGPNGIVLYTTQSIPPNVDLVLEIHHPKKFVIQSRVVWCQYQSSSPHVMTGGGAGQAYPYRLGAAFRFASDADAQAFQQFCESMGKAYAYNGKIEEEAPASFAEAPAADAPAAVSGDAPTSASAPGSAEAAATPAAVDAGAPAPAGEAAATPAADNVTSLTDALAQVGVSVPGDGEKKAA